MSKPQKIFILIVGLVALGLGIAVTLYYNHIKQELRLIATPAGQEAAAKEEVQETLAELKKLVVVPDEDPVVATIRNVEELQKESAFYKGASNGDKLILFSQSQRAYIYSRSQHKLVNAGSLVFEKPSSE